MFNKSSLFSLFFIILFIVSWQTSDAASQDHFYFRHYEVEDGLSQNMVYCIFQDRQGFMWFGTQDGLNRYDGHHFKIFKKDSNKVNTIGSNGIFSFYEDKKGSLWIGTSNGIYIYNPQLENFSRFEQKTATNIGIEGIVRDIKEDGLGNIWIVDAKDGVFKFSTQGTLEVFSLKKNVETEPLTVRKLTFDGNNNVWIATDRGGLFCIHSLSEKIDHYTMNDNDGSLDLKDLLFLDSNTLLVATSTRGVQIFHLDSHQWSVLLEYGKDNKPLFVRRIYKTQSGNFWFGTESGVYIYNPQTKQIQHLGHIYNDPYAITDNAIHAIYQDREGGIWLGTFFGGVNYFSDSYAQFEKYYPSLGRNSISGKSISEFCQDDHQNIWIGTEDAGLNLFDPHSSTFLKGFIPATNIHSLFYENNHLWVGSFSEGLFNLDISSKKVKSYKSTTSPYALNCNSIYSIYRDKAGILWLGTMIGLQTYDELSNQFTTIKKDEIDCQVNDILEDKYGVVWFATLGKGLYAFNRERNEWKHYPSPIAHDISGKMVTCITIDHKQQLWVGTEGAGLCRYDQASDTFEQIYNTGNGLPNDVIYKMVEDASGALWGSTNKGLFKIDLTSGSITNFTHNNGLLGDQFNYKSGFMSNEGKLYFGLIKGFVSFFPNRLQTNPTPPSIVINSFQIFNKEIIPGAKDKFLSKSITQTHEINIPYNSSFFSLGFAALSYVSPEGNKYAYKLEGRDKNWVFTNQLNRITYSDLPVGSYVFHVKAANSDGLWNQNGTSIAINILPPFYRTGWAYISYAILFLLLIYWIVRASLNRVKTHNANILQELEIRKEKELYDAKITFFTNITHEIRTPLSLIKSPVEEIIKELDTDNKHWDHLSIIQRNTNRLLLLVNELLDFRKAETKGLKLNFTHQDVNLLIRDVVARFVPSSNIQGISIVLNGMEHSFFADIDSEIITKVLSNMLNNALKHANTSIEIYFSSTEDCFKLTIANDGDFVEAQYANHIFDPFTKLNEHSLGSGLGLPLSRSLIELHKGKLFLNIEDTVRTSFIIELPIHQEHVIKLDKEIQHLNNRNTDEQLTEMNELISGEDKKTILSVEDNEEFQNFMTKQLAPFYHIIKVHNGREALNILDKQFVDIIISDLMMPVMDGMELCANIKENIQTSHIPLILLTAKTTLQSKIDSMRIGADEYIEKPYSIDFLKARIENLLENRRKLQESYKESPEMNFEAIVHSTADKEFIHKLVDVIHQHLNEIDLDVDQLATAMNMSRATFYRKVKSLSELTPNDFIRLIRLKKAAELLNEKDYRINEIAFMVGFNSPSYFSKCFLKQFGVLPKDFVKNKGK